MPIDNAKFAEYEKQFPRLGDIVILNSGGPNMMVIKNNDQSVRCMWPDSEGKLRKASFPYECVTKMAVVELK